MDEIGVVGEPWKDPPPEVVQGSWALPRSFCFLLLSEPSSSHAPSPFTFPPPPHAAVDVVRTPPLVPGRWPTGRRVWSVSPSSESQCRLARGEQLAHRTSRIVSVTPVPRFSGGRPISLVHHPSRQPQSCRSYCPCRTCSFPTFEPIVLPLCCCPVPRLLVCLRCRLSPGTYASSSFLH